MNQNKHADSSDTEIPHSAIRTTPTDKTRSEFESEESPNSRMMMLAAGGKTTSMNLKMSGNSSKLKQ